MSQIETCFSSGDMADQAAKAFRECAKQRDTLNAALTTTSEGNAKLLEQRDELLAALKSIAIAPAYEMLAIARDAIAKQNSTKKE
jgi:hypothetical protein